MEFSKQKEELNRTMDEKLMEELQVFGQTVPGKII